MVDKTWSRWSDEVGVLDRARHAAKNDDATASVGFVSE